MQPLGRRRRRCARRSARQRHHVDRDRTRHRQRYWLRFGGFFGRRTRFDGGKLRRRDFRGRLRLRKIFSSTVSSFGSKSIGRWSKGHSPDARDIFCLRSRRPYRQRTRLKVFCKIKENAMVILTKRALRFLRATVGEIFCARQKLRLRRFLPRFGFDAAVNAEAAAADSPPEDRRRRQQIWPYSARLAASRGP
jgi:hypothetical protein